MLVRGIVIESPGCDGRPAMPQGTIIEGSVKAVHRVGMGFRHEVGSLELEFDRVLPEFGSPITIRTRVMGVDNARERVKNGVIHGIRSTNSPQDHLRSRLAYFLMWHPESFWLLPVYRAVFPVFPEPELFFPAGTDIVLALAEPLPVPESSVFASSEQPLYQDLPAALNEEARSFPDRSSTPSGLGADVVNLAFVGTEEQISHAFRSSGWKGADAMSSRTALREINAFLLLRNYPRGPMTNQLLKGRASVSTWQKGFDTLSKRDHLRIWSAPETWQQKQVWLSASTREIGAIFSIRKRHFIHLVDPNIDDERGRVVRDLTLAGCVESTHNIARPAVPNIVTNATGRDLETDGAIAVVELKDCDHPVFDGDSAVSILTRPPSKFARYMRTQVLSARGLWRENAVYGAFELGRVGVRRLTRKHAVIDARLDNRRPVKVAFPSLLPIGSAPGTTLGEKAANPN